eukprot:COSAG06_NODE_4464_length_4229_cov_2.660291_1_plen_316_part_00
MRATALHEIVAHRSHAAYAAANAHVSTGTTHTKTLSYTLYLSRHGESLANVDGVIGGDASLSPRGQSYANRLCSYIESEAPLGSPIWTSALQRTLQTIKPLQQLLAPSPLTTGLQHADSADTTTTTTTTSTSTSTTTILLPTPRDQHVASTNVAFQHSVRPGLNEIDAGPLIDGLVESDARALHGDVMAARKADKLRYRYPGGESYLDLMERVGAECKELDTLMQARSSRSTRRSSRTQGASPPTADANDAAESQQAWVVAHQATLRVLLAYFRGTEPAEIPHTIVPLHTLFQMVVHFCPATGDRVSCQLRQIYL